MDYKHNTKNNIIQYINIFGFCKILYSFWSLVFCAFQFAFNLLLFTFTSFSFSFNFQLILLLNHARCKINKLVKRNVRADFSSKFIRAVSMLRDHFHIRSWSVSLFALFLVLQKVSLVFVLENKCEFLLFIRAKFAFKRLLLLKNSKFKIWFIYVSI